jgi:hypothetical protein
VARERCLEPAALGRMDHGEEGGRIDGEHVEDRPEGSLESVDGGPAQTRPPAAVDDRREVGPHLARRARGLPGAHRGVVLRGVAQRLAVRCRDRDIPPTAQAAQEKLVGTGPHPEVRHGGALAVDVLQNVGPQGERDQPRSTGPRVGCMVPSRPMRQAVLRLAVELNRVGDQSL